MTAVTYTAARSVLPGHTAGVSYELDLRLIDATPTQEVERSDQVSLSRKRETLFWNTADGLAITIGSFEELSAENDAVLEFLDSVKGGEPFTFDRWGRAGAPANPRTAVMTGVYSPSRYLRRAGEGNDLMRYSFSIEFA